jgi:hypothetical protein
MTLGSIDIDGFFEGGIPCRQITEFIGESATGKTQTMLQLALTVQWPKDYGGMAGSCIFFDTQSLNWTKRIEEIAEFHLKNFGFGGQNALKNILVQKHIGDSEELYRKILMMENTIRDYKIMPVHLIIIDSIDEENKQITKFNFNCKIYQKLEYYAWYYNIAVVTTSLLVDKFKINYFDLASKYTSPQFNRTYSLEIPRLKLDNSWSDCINNRILVVREAPLKKQDGTLTDLNLVKRMFIIISSGHIPNDCCLFKVEKFGISTAQ